MLGRVLVIAAIANWLGSMTAFAQGFYAIAHMTNSPAAVDWAIKQGANAVEIDLQFDANGKPTVFSHGSPCDCTCILGTYGICKDLSSVCGASTNAADLLKHVAKTGLALVVIDSKIAASDSEAKQKQAGAAVAQLVTANLLDSGYSGKVIVSAAPLKAITYVAAVVNDIQKPTHRSHVYFTIDQANEVVPTLQSMIDTIPSANRVYGTGSSACLPTQFLSGVALAAKNVKAGVIGLVYNWTIDKTSSMEQYLASGANGIMTNDPKALVDLVKSKQINLATPQTIIPPATSANVVKQ